QPASSRRLPSCSGLSPRSEVSRASASPAAAAVARIIRSSAWLACSADGQRFLTAGPTAGFGVYDTRRRGLSNLCQAGSLTAGRVDGHRGRVCALTYHPQGRRRPAEFGHLFVSGGWDNTVQIWDDRRQRSLWVYFGPHVCGSDAIDVDPAQGHILTGSWERHKSMLQVWKFNEDAAHGRLDLDDKSVQEDMLRGRPLGELQQDPTGTPSMGYVAQWLGTQYMVFAGSNANALKIVDRSTLNVR
uniref:WD_REPEATS_REGION domain-containing protein n=1 Tax=Macrostomum lignano TaxID=282301 RepID=A0A1I8HJR1_9PLAT